MTNSGATRTTVIRVQDSTKTRIKDLKQGDETYDQVIQRLLALSGLEIKKELFIR